MLVLIGASMYVNEVVVPATPPLFIATPTPTRSPESLANEAREAFNTGNLPVSVTTYEEAVNADPGNASLYLELARVQIFAGEYEGALTNTKNALLLNDKNPVAQALHGWALYFLNDDLAAEAAFKEALAQDPTNAFAHAFWAEMLAYNGDIDQAIAESRAAVDQAPELLEVRRARAIVFYVTNNFPEAIQELKAALAINDNIPDLHILLGLNYMGLEDYALAVDAFGVADTLNPNNPEPDYYISRAYFRQGEYAKAIQYGEQAVANAPDDPLMHAVLGMALYRNTDYEEAIREMGIAVQGIPLTDDGSRVAIELYVFYAYAYLKSNRCDQAVPILQLLLNTVPDDPFAGPNANDGIELCQDGDASTPTPEAGTDETQTDETPEPESTPTPSE